MAEMTNVGNQMSSRIEYRLKWSQAGYFGKPMGMDLQYFSQPWNR